MNGLSPRLAQEWEEIGGVLPAACGRGGSRLNAELDVGTAPIGRAPCLECGQGTCLSSAPAVSCDLKRHEAGISRQVFCLGGTSFAVYRVGLCRVLGREEEIDGFGADWMP